MPEKDKISASDFASKIKLKYPEYKDIDDSVLASKMVEKYPEYKDVVYFETLKKKEPTPSVSSNTQLPLPSRVPKEASPVLTDLSFKGVSEALPKAAKQVGGEFEIGETATLKPSRGVKPIADKSLPNIKEAIDDAVNQYQSKYVFSTDAKDKIEKAYKSGDLVPIKNSKGESKLIRGTGVIESFGNAVNKRFEEEALSSYLANAPKQEQIKFLNNKLNNPQEVESAPSGTAAKVSEFVGENAGMLAKGLTAGIGASALALPTGGASFAQFLSMLPDMAYGGYSGTLEKNYIGLKQSDPNISDDEAYEKSHKAALLGEVTGIATNAALAGSISQNILGKVPKPTVQVKGVIDGIINSAKHAIKSYPKVGGVSVAGSVVNDLASNVIGNKVEGDEIGKNALESAKQMAVMHFGLWGLTEPFKIPSYIRPQIENVVASAPREKVQEFYEDGEKKGIFPEGTTQKVLSKLSEFDEQKAIVSKMPLSEEQKAAIVGKLLQRKKIQEENSELKKYGASFNDKIEANEKKIEELDAETNNIAKTNDFLKYEKDNLTGRPAKGTPEEISQPIELSIEEEPLVMEAEIKTPQVEEQVIEIQQPTEVEKPTTETVSEVIGEPKEKEGELKAEVKGFTAKEGNKVVDEKGEPLTVYHGTKEDFTEFDESKMGATDEGWWGKGFYFHTDPNRGGYGDIVKSVNVDLKKPIDLPINKSGEYLYDIIGEKAGLDKSFRNKSAMAIIKEIGSDNFTKLAKELGYDGVIVNYAEGTKEIVAFDKKQIKILKEKSEPKVETPKEQVKPIEKTRQEKINDLVDRASALTAMRSNAPERASVKNKLNIEAAEFGLKYSERDGKLVNEKGNEIQKREPITNKTVVKDFDRKKYSKETNDSMDFLADNPTAMSGFEIVGTDGKRLSKKQIEQAAKSIKEGKVNYAAKTMFDFIEKAHKQGGIELEDTTTGQRALVPIKEYFDALKTEEDKLKQADLDDLVNNKELEQSDEYINQLIEQYEQEYSEENNESKPTSEGEIIKETSTGTSVEENGEENPKLVEGSKDKEPPTEPPTKDNDKNKEEPFKQKMRSFYRNVINRAKGLTVDEKKLLQENPNALYDVLPHAESRKIAKELIDEIGVEKAILEATDKSSGLAPVERVMILGAAMDYYSGLAKEQAKLGNEKSVIELANKEIDAQEKMLQIADTLATMGTDYGRAISIFNEVYKLSNIALERKLKNKVGEVNKARNANTTQQAKDISKIVSNDELPISEAAQDLTETQLMREADAMRKVKELEKEVEDLKKEILQRDNAAKGTKKNPLKIKRVTNDTEYDKRLKEFQQRQRSIISKDDVTDLTYFGLYHIENGLTKFADWYNVMNRKFGGFKDSLVDIYKNVKDKAVSNGADLSLFDTDRAVKDFFANTKAEKIQSIKDLLNEQIEEVRQQIIEKDQKQKQENKKPQKDLETERLEEQLASLEELRDKYIPELPETFEFEKKREKVKDGLVKSIIDLNEQINAGEKKKKVEGEKYEGDAEIEALKKIKKQKQKILDKITGLSEEEKKKLSDARQMVLKTKKAAIAKFKQAMDDNPNRARVQAPKLAAERIRKDAERNLDMPSTKTEQTYLKKLVQTINQKAKEYYKEKKENVKNINDILAFAIANNKSDYKIWDRTKEEVERQIDADTSLTEEQKAEVKDFLNDYTESIFDTLLTKNQIEETIRQKLIENGFGIEKVVNGKVVKSVDWNKIIGNAKNIKEAKEKIVKSIADLGINLDEAKGEIDAILNQFDSKVTDKKTAAINAYLNKGIVNKVKSALGKKQANKTQISKLVEMNNKGILDDERVKDVLAEELGIISLSKEDLAKVRELSTQIDRYDIPEFMRKQFQEQLQYLFDSKSGNLPYLENRESVMANRLSSVYNQIQNSTGFFRVISTLATIAAKTKNPKIAARVFGRELLNSIQDAKTILLKGRVSRGSSFSDLTMTTEGEPRVRYLEQGKGKFLSGSFLGRPLYVKMGNKSIDVNPINQAYSRVKYIQRLLEAVDTPSSGISSGLTQYWQIGKAIDKYYPELSPQEKAKKVWDIMYSLDRKAEVPNAIQMLKNAGVENPTQAEINRTINEKQERLRNDLMAKEFNKQLNSIKPIAETKLKDDGNANPTSEQIEEQAYKMLGYDEPLDVVARGERQAARETGKSTTVGITSIILMPLDAMQKRISMAMRQNTTRSGQIAANSVDAAASQLFPFAHSIGRWTEMQLELTPYGALKGLLYKSGLARDIQGGDKSKVSKQEYSELGDDYIIRSVLGASYTVAAMYAVGLAKKIAGDDDEAEDAIIGTDKAEKFTQERVQSVGKPKQTIQIGGRNIPIQLLGNEGIVLGMYADYLKNRKDPAYAEKGMLYISSMVTLSSIIESTWYSNAAKYGGVVSSLVKGKEDTYKPALGKVIGGLIGSQVPFNRGQVELATVLNPESKSSKEFGVNLQNQFSIVRAFDKTKPNFDFRGRTYEYGDIYVNSADGVMKMFSKAKYGDKIDEFLADINFAATDAYRTTKEEDNYKYAIENKDGTKRFMTNEEYYDFKYAAAKEFNRLIELNFDVIKSEEIQSKGVVDNIKTMAARKELASYLWNESKSKAIKDVQLQATGSSRARISRQEEREKDREQMQKERFKNKLKGIGANY